MNLNKKSHKRLKSTSPKKSKNRYALYNSKKKESLLAIEDTKKLYTKLFSNPNNIILNQLKGDNIKVYINAFQPKDIQILAIIISKYFYFNSIQIGAFDPEKGEDSKSQKITEIINKEYKFLPIFINILLVAKFFSFSILFLSFSFW